MYCRFSSNSLPTTEVAADTATVGVYGAGWATLMFEMLRDNWPAGPPYCQWTWVRPHESISEIGEKTKEVAEAVAVAAEVVMMGRVDKSERGEKGPGETAAKPKKKGRGGKT